MDISLVLLSQIQDLDILIGSEPIVVFDAPLSYSNIPLIYSEDSSAGVGTQATVDIVVGQGSSVIDFEIRNFGYSYAQNQILTVATGGSTGIPTDTNYSFKEFQLTVDKVDSDKFSAWHFGELERLDNINENLMELRENSQLREMDLQLLKSSSRI